MFLLSLTAQVRVKSHDHSVLYFIILNDKLIHRWIKLDFGFIIYSSCGEGGCGEGGGVGGGPYILCS